MIESPSPVRCNGLDDPQLPRLLPKARKHPRLPRDDKPRSRSQATFGWWACRVDVDIDDLDAGLALGTAVARMPGPVVEPSVTELGEEKTFLVAGPSRVGGSVIDL